MNSGLPNANEFEGVRYFQRAGEPTTYYFLPDVPDAERHAQKRPSLMMVASDQGAYLQLGTRWEVDSDKLERLRARLASENNLPSDSIRLQAVPLTIESVTLSIGDGEGNFSELRRANASGYGSMAAIFNATLNGEQKANALAALNGRKGFLIVTYCAHAAIGGTSVLLSATTDISEWFPGGAGPDHVQMTGASITPRAKAAPATVKLGFDPKGSPVKSIEVASGATMTPMRAPFFDPVKLPVGESSGFLAVKTIYCMDGAPYEAKLTEPGNDAWVIKPSDLGLAVITLDASALKKSGASAAQVTVRYLPQSAGIQEEQVFRFRYGDWQERWFVVTRDPGLSGKLEIAVRETKADGERLDHPPLVTEQTEIVL